MRSLIVHLGLTTAVILGGLLVGCSRSEPALRMGAPDLQAISNIHETSAGVFHNSSIDIHVHERGTIELEVRGHVEPRDNGAPGPDSAQGEDSDQDWIPILLIHKLPEYFEVLPSGTGAPPVSLEAYKFKDGLWCLAAVVNRSVGKDRVEPSSSSRPELNVRIVLASNQFAHELPFLIPAGQAAEPVAVSIGLPTGAHFYGAASQIGVSTMQGLREEPHFAGPQNTALQDLTQIPAAAKEGQTLAATFYSPDAVAFDFSSLGYSQPGFFSRFQPWLPPAEVLLVLCAAMLWLRTDLTSYLGGIIANATATLELAVMDALNRLDATDVELQRLFENEPADSIRRLEPAWAEVAKELRVLLRAFPGSGLRREPEDHLPFVLLGDFRIRFEQAMRTQELPRAASDVSRADLAARLLNRLERSLRFLDSNREQLIQARIKNRRLPRIAWYIGALALLVAAILLGVLAHAQSVSSAPRPRQHASDMLGDLYVALTPHQVSEKSKVDVQLRFSPLSGDPRVKRVHFALGTGDSPKVSIDPVAAPTDTKVTVEWHDHLLTVDAPVTYSRTLHRLVALTDLISDFKIPPEFASEVAAAHRVSLSYTLDGAATAHTRSSRPWLYLFPFDSTDIDIPIDVRQPYLLSHLQVDKPSGDYAAEVSVKGLPITVDESENGERYVFESEDSRVRTPVWDGRKAYIRAHFERTTFQVYLLTIGLALGAIFAGIWSGWFFTRPDTSIGKYILTSVGLVGAVIGVRTGVGALYKDLPTFPGPAISYFDLIYLACVLLMGVAIWGAYKIAK